MNKVTLLLGSNLGNKKNNITSAINLIDSKIGLILKKTKIIESEPEDYYSSNNYLNIGIIVSTDLSPIKLLKSIKEIERSLGRINDSYFSGKYEDRTIDIDIIYFNSITFYSASLNIPHISHISKRNFSKKILYELL
ncbi:2-amino-4-hydroxy-6-hydroxymethyldihydropteridine diphosphokinase [Apibacter sp. B3706]|uniref:2-amino-4-hydroxy-6- hydroxymethyldihydropteridine diphosphokinase n=1 Tax=unclassified Apibacter TaxID=2630820 RepID=UPI000CF985A2|nr:MULTISPECIES: 2-amino-4-hydroxy-6-hydroxymethyldihydropteridine diphosphokinase [unclassified Apibacter]MXP05351.1 2-amino-4-hydroxy-6-hydroxymethyldihydropteridine diphosphokinase [Apibacter sp. B3546]MXP11750.1 2-amino-4-hydroxy-6-hydroxymethyldihydropteridine diphosphokinase [Apibacter sp. B3239]PQL90259.1 2-amino-4-hydroxy-6-hydroxymethyldihydropteridine diphosphokinase [Apibacter sp. wkB309]QII69521.1 2-amino-4-hydroxy-6-hydroxymethyldihydropteridine diphosphokinase [Apibacter sp. B3706